MMTLDKAIEILDDFHNDPNAFFTQDLPDAIKLGIEALKAWQRLKQGHQFTTSSMLPSETSEIDTKRSLHHIKENLQGIGEHP